MEAINIKLQWKLCWAAKLAKKAVMSGSQYQTWESPLFSGHEWSTPSSINNFQCFLREMETKPAATFEGWKSCFFFFFLTSYNSGNIKERLCDYIIIPDVLRGIDDLFDARYTQSDVHGRHAGKVESFQGHLSTRLSDALGTKGPHCGAGLHLSSGGVNTR